jgi:hypothetical protein
MDYGMITQIEKARQYTDEPQRIKFTKLHVTFTGDNNTYQISLVDNDWHCTCPGFQNYHICPHIMALEKLLKPMIKRTPLPYASGQNVVSDVEKARRYADETDRIEITAFEAIFEGNNSNHVVNYDHGVWDSDSTSFRLRKVSSHTIAMERLLKGVLKPAAESEAQAEPVAE